MWPAGCSRYCSDIENFRTSSRSSAWTSFPMKTSWRSARARKIENFLSQPMFVAEVFTGLAGKYVSRADTVRSFKEILEGKWDQLPEQAFYMVGAIEEAVEKAKKMEGTIDN